MKKIVYGGVAVALLLVVGSPSIAYAEDLRSTASYNLEIVSSFVLVLALIGLSVNSSRRK